MQKNSKSLSPDEKKLRSAWFTVLAAVLILVLGVFLISQTNSALNSASNSEYSALLEDLEIANENLTQALSEQSLWIQNNPPNTDTSWVDRGVEIAEQKVGYAEKALSRATPPSGFSKDTLFLLQVALTIFVIGSLIALSITALVLFRSATRKQREEAQKKRIEEIQAFAEQQRLEELKNPVNPSLRSLGTFGFVFILVGIVLTLIGVSIVSNAIDNSLFGVNAGAVSDGAAFQVTGNWLFGVGVALLIARSLASAINWQIRQSIGENKKQLSKNNSGLSN